jgi:HlyD family secretion protein
MQSKPPSLDALRIDRSQAPLKAGGSGRGWIILITLIAVGAVVWWFMRPKGIPVKTTTVQLHSTGGNGSRTLLNASGYVTTRLDATVSSKITGKVMEILVEEGMKVEKGQILARLDSSNVEASLHLAEARLESAKLALAETEPMVRHTEAEMNRLTALANSRSVSVSEISKARADASMEQAKLERLEADVTVAERQVDEWKQQMDDAIIRAPFAGVATTKDAQPGEVISPMSAGGGFTRTGICTLVDMASLEIEVDVGESFINRVKAGQPVESTLDAYPEWKIPGKVIAIIPTADRQKATVKVRVSFDQLDPRILPQMGVKVAFLSEETPGLTAVKSSLSVPKNAIQKDANRDIAWVVSDGKVERRAVTVSQSAGNDTFLTAGLTAGETVVTDPPSTLTDGATVTVETSR